MEEGGGRRWRGREVEEGGSERSTSSAQDSTPDGLLVGGSHRISVVRPIRSLWLGGALEPDVWWDRGFHNYAEERPVGKLC